MARVKGSSGLDALFSRVFDDSTVKDAISALHGDFSPPSPPPEAPTQINSNLAHSEAEAIIASIEEYELAAPPPLPKDNGTILASNQSNNQAVKQTDKQSNKQTNKETNRLSIKQSNNQAAHQPTEQSYQQLDSHGHQQSPQQAIEQTYHQSTKQTIKQSDRYTWLPFTRNQGEILVYLYEKGGGLTNMDIICAETAIPYGTARVAIDVLASEGYVTSKERHNGHSFRGFSYTLNNHLCSMYIARIRGEQSSEQSFQQANKQSLQQALQQSPKQSEAQAIWQAVKLSSNQTINQSSTPKEVRSSLDNKLTTTINLIGIELNEPELRWWSDQGLTVAKTAEWLREFSEQGLVTQDLSRSLKYAWYDAIINKVQPGGKPIDRPLNWFYRFLPGGYPQPSNYRSFQQLQIDRERQELEELEQQARELAEIRNKKMIAVLEIKFQQLLTDKNEDYDNLLALVSSLEKDMGGHFLEKALRVKYFESNGITI